MSSSQGLLSNVLTVYKKVLGEFPNGHVRHLENVFVESGSKHFARVSRPVVWSKSYIEHKCPFMRVLVHIFVITSPNFAWTPIFSFQNVWEWVLCKDILKSSSSMVICNIVHLKAVLRTYPHQLTIYVKKLWPGKFSVPLQFDINHALMG